MFENTGLPTILMPSLLVLFVAFFILNARMNHSTDAARKALTKFKCMTVGTGIFLVILLFCLPSTPALGTFGFPKSVADIQSPEQLLGFLQTYNRALVRTTEVLYWFLFVFVWWFLATLYSLTRALGERTNASLHPVVLQPES